MEEVLELYQQEYDPLQPVVCFDETNKQLIEEVRLPLPAQAGEKGVPGQVERYDYQYQRNGTRNLFLFCEPLAGWRHVEVTQQRTKLDFAHQIRWLLDHQYPHVQVVHLVLDNLNTHRPASLYEAFEPQEARRLLRRLQWHYTPKHGSWLNMAEIEFGILSNQCLNRRIGTCQKLQHEVAAWQNARNAQKAKIKWRFTCQDARYKLNRLYPSTLG